MEFYLEDKFPCPKISDYSTIVTNGGVLLLAPEYPSWIYLNAMQHKIWKLLAEGNTLGQALQNFRATNGEEDLLIRAMQILISMAINNQFVSEAQTLDRVFEREIILYLTEHCNLTCSHCFMTEHELSSNEIGFPDWCKVLEEYSELHPNGKALLTGGEPLLFRRIQSIVEYGHSLGLAISINTNGTLLTEDTWSKLVSQLWGFQLSLDGFSATVHDAIRGKGTFARVTDAISVVLANPGDVRFRLSVSVMPQNIDSISEELLPFLSKWDAKKRLTVVFTPVAPIGRASVGEMSTTIEQIEESIENVIFQMNEEGWNYDVDMSPCIRQRKCGIGEHLVIHSNGDVSPCNFSKERRHFNSLRSAFEYYKKSYSQCTVENSSKCMNCELRYVCFMGCQVRNAVEGNAPLHPFCPPDRKTSIVRRLVRREMIHRKEIESQLTCTKGVRS